MCMEDIRLGRKSVQRTSFLTTDGAGLLRFGASPNRVAIAFGAGSISIFGCPGPATAAQTATGYAINSGFTPYIFRIEEWGEAVPGVWDIFTSTPSSPVVVTEVILQDQ